MKVDTSHLAQDDASSHEFSNIMHVGDFVDQGSPDGYVRVVVISAADWEIEQARVAALEADAERMKDALLQIKEMTDAEGDEDTYRLDDPEGCFDMVFAIAEKAIKPDAAMKGGA